MKSFISVSLIFCFLLSPAFAGKKETPFEKHRVAVLERADALADQLDWLTEYFENHGELPGDVTKSSALALRKMEEDIELYEGLDRTALKHYQGKDTALVRYVRAGPAHGVTRKVLIGFTLLVSAIGINETFIPALEAKEGMIAFGWGMLWGYAVPKVAAFFIRSHDKYFPAWIARDIRSSEKRKLMDAFFGRLEARGYDIPKSKRPLFLSGINEAVKVISCERS